MGPTSLNWVNQGSGGCILGYRHTGFYVTSVSGVPTPITAAGSYTLVAGGLAAPSTGAVSYQWTVKSSNGAIDSVTTGFQGASYPLTVPAGSYSITVAVTPKDLFGTGYPMQWTYPVCTGGGGQQSQSVTPDVVGGCN